MTNPVEGMVRSRPAPQNAFDIFRGEWAYDIPVEGTTTGRAIDFRRMHHSVWQCRNAFGSLGGMRVLELGPNEGEVAFHLHHAGCREVVSVEGRVRSYLKCLVVKNYLKMDSVTFHLGDFVGHLEATTERYDLCMAAGVLYHMTDPLRLLELIARSCDRVAIATHHFTESMLRFDRAKDTTGLPDAVWNFVNPQGEDATRAGLTVKYYKYLYAGDAARNEVHGHGGPEAHASMMRLDDIVRALAHFGMRVVGGIDDDPDGVRGAHAFLVAARS